MRVVELLDELKDNVLRSAAGASLWTDRTLLSYLAEGQDILCRETHALVDNEVTVVALPGERKIKLPCDVIFIYDAVNGATNARMCVVPAIVAMMPVASGSPSRLALDVVTGCIHVDPCAIVEETITLRVARLASIRPSDATLDSELELADRFCYGLVEYAAFKALSHEDLDGGNKQAAQMHYAEWQRFLTDVKQEIYRARLGANPVASWRF